ncbi:MAG: tRNA (adenosine(37)-N6)-threonylcarbamoyltransferase complex ATPase subunit type 1 TsaE [Acidobacteria bacterium]|nr:tRNA (adenosine(37)-N6)-threonylcarbamoyltransferase complex ATPase subunit type 1 TsaE [Acidobacteriota bacterium]
MIVRTKSADETRQLGVELAARLRPDGTALLFGDLGSGKTVLTQGIAEGLGLDAALVQSPTFTLIHEYDRDPHSHRGPVRLVHVDLYRLEPEEVEAIGIEEFLAGDGVKVVEWADRLPRPPSALEVRLRTGDGPEEREVEITC